MTVMSESGETEARLRTNRHVADPVPVNLLFGFQLKP